jgi:hypothetical protein
MTIWDGKLSGMVNLGHVDAQWATLFQDAAGGDRLAERNILNAQLSYQRGKTAITAYGTNLTNQHMSPLIGYPVLEVLILLVPHANLASKSPSHFNDF